MNTQTAAVRLLEKLSVPATRQSCRSTSAIGVPHAIWMLEGIADGYVQHEKAHRWLGYAQALLVSDDVITLDQAKEINKTS